MIEFFKKRLRIVQHVIGEVEGAKIFLKKSSASVDQLVEQLTTDPKVPVSTQRWGS